MFDKTGTLTKGTFSVTEVHPEGMTEEALLELAAYAESYSSHPISRSLQKAYGKQLDPAKIRHVEEIPGHGVRAQLSHHFVLAGNDKLMAQEKLFCPAVETMGTVVYMAVDGKYAGYIIISDEIKDDAPKAVEDLRKSGVKNLTMLTGDGEYVANMVAKKLHMDRVYAELLPAEKVEAYGGTAYAEIPEREAGVCG